MKEHIEKNFPLVLTNWHKLIIFGHMGTAEALNVTDSLSHYKLNTANLRVKADTCECETVTL